MSILSMAASGWIAVWVGLADAPRMPSAAPAEVGLDAGRLARIDAAVERALRDQKAPGCVVLVARRGKIVHHKAYGQRALQPRTEPMTTDTVFDLASLTKPVATAASTMLLVERGLVRTSDRLADHFPGYLPEEPTGVTIAELLTHTAGFIPDNPMSDYSNGPLSARDRLFRLLPSTPPGEKFIYSDVGYMLLGELVLAKTGKTLAEFSAENLFAPLGMKDTMFSPPESLRQRCAPTETRAGKPIRGVVHDPRAFALGGVAGHAGLFGTAEDLAVFAEMLHGRGQFAGAQVLSPRIVDLMVRPRELPGGTIRSFGWDMRSGYSGNRGETFSDAAFGHGGFTGTAIWIDPVLQMTVVFLSNRVHPDGKGAVNPLIGRIGTICGSSVLQDAKTPGEEYRGPPLKPPPTERRPTATEKETKPKPGKPTLTGVDVLERDGCVQLTGKRVGLVTNQTGSTRTGKSTIDLLRGAKDVTLVALFSPEHGIRGEVDATVPDGKEAKTGLPIHSLYGKARKPTAESLRDLDVLVYDVQDMGARFYTYISTLGLCMEAAAEHKLKFMVLDRPNPIGGAVFAGPMRDAGQESFTAYHSLPVQHAMTVGELAKMFQAERKLKIDLTIVPVENWRRGDAFDATGLVWIDPSPNLRNLTQAILYPGIGLLETTNVSVGRGTDSPFEIFGAPWLRHVEAAEDLNRAGLVGATFTPVQFTPKSSTFKGELCKGVRIAVVDRGKVNPMQIGLAIAGVLRKRHAKEWDIARYNRLLCHKKTLDAITAERPFREIEASWRLELEQFAARRKAVLLYE